MTLSQLVSQGNPDHEAVLRVLLEKERRRRQREADIRRKEAEGVQQVKGSSLRFRGASLEAQTIVAPEWMLAGPSETSKTTAGLHRVEAELRRVPGSRWGLIRKVRNDMDTTVLETWRALIAHRGDWRPLGGRHPDSYVNGVGSELFIGGMDRPGKVLSGERDGIYFCQAEEAELSDWETLSTRVTGRGAKTDTPMLCGDCNPGPSEHWILKRPRLRVLHSKHVDNPFLFDDDGNPTPQWTLRTQPTLEALTGVRRERLYHGRWVAAEGVVYEDFDRALHVLPRFEIPADWRWIGAVDFGFTNPFVFQLWAIDPDGRIYLVHEIYRIGKLVSDHAKDINELIAGKRLEALVADHDAEDRATLAAAGLETIAAVKSVSPGIQAVQKRLRKAGDGKPRLFVFEDALVSRDPELDRRHRPCSTLSEFEVYSWPVASDGKPSKEAPVKEHDHGMDAMRYTVAHLDGIEMTDASFWLSVARSAKQPKS